MLIIIILLNVLTFLYFLIMFLHLFLLLSRMT